MKKYARALWQPVFVVAAYFIWKARNDRVFKGKDQTSSRTFHDIQIKSFEWLGRRSKKYSFSWQKWLERPADCSVPPSVVLG